MNNKLLVLGTVAYDKIASPLGSVDKILGGSGMYAACAASFFKSNPAINSIIGYDFDETDLNWIASMGVDISGVEQHPTEKTFFWEGKYHTDLNKRDTLDTQLNVLPLYQPKIATAWKDSSFILLGNLDPSIQLDIISQTDNQSFVALDTMNFWIDTAKDKLLAVISKVNLVIINDEEAKQLTENHNLVKAAQELLSKGPEYVIIKKGEHGALLFSQNQTFSAAALPLSEVFDPTGAGDCFAGGLLGYLASQKNISFDTLKTGVVYGSTVASFCVEKFGPENLKHIDQKTIENRADEFAKLVSFNL